MAMSIINNNNNIELGVCSMFVCLFYKCFVLLTNDVCNMSSSWSFGINFPGWNRLHECRDFAIVRNDFARDNVVVAAVEDIICSLHYIISL